MKSNIKRISELVNEIDPVIIGLKENVLIGGDNASLTGDEESYKRDLFTSNLISAFSFDLFNAENHTLPKLPRKVKEYVLSEAARVHPRHSTSGGAKFSFEAFLHLRAILLFRQIFLFASQVNQLANSGESAAKIDKVADSTDYFQISLELRKDFEFITRSGLNEEINSYLQQAAELGKFKFTLDEGKVNLAGADFIIHLKEIEWEKITRCAICDEYFQASRKDAKTCSAKCSNILRQRRWYKKKKS